MDDELRAYTATITITNSETYKIPVHAPNDEIARSCAEIMLKAGALNADPVQINSGTTITTEPI